MNRTTRRKISSFLALAILILSYKFLFDEGGRFALPFPYQLILLWTIIILVNIPTFAFRKVFVARRLARRGDNEEAAKVAQQFINEIEATRLKRFICQSAIEVYTDKPEVHGYMCLARATRQAGDAPKAIAIYKRAIEIDPLCPTAHIGLAITVALHGDEPLATRYLDRARELGYSGSLSDRLFLDGGETTANLALLFPTKRQ